jgi:hypothetical protein
LIRNKSISGLKNRPDIKAYQNEVDTTWPTVEYMNNNARTIVADWLQVIFETPVHTSVVIEEVQTIMWMPVRWY